MPLCRALLAFGLFWAATMGDACAAVFYPSFFTLSNGLQVIVVPNRLAPVVSQMVWYKVGASDEPAGKSGLAHYLEHLMFRGTKTLPAGEFSKTVAGQGGRDNAFTSYDYTAYYIEAAADRLPMMMQMEADRMQNLLIAPETAEPELRVVIEERQQRTDNSPQGRFVENLKKKFMPRHPYGRPVIGWRRDIERLTVADARKFYDTYYTPNNAILVVSGDVTVARVLSLASATFGRIPLRAVPDRGLLPPLPTAEARRYMLRDSRIEQPEIVWKFAVPSYATHQDGLPYAFEVLGEILDAGEIGLLYQALVVDQGLASGVDTSYHPDARGETVFTIATSVRPGQTFQKLEKALREVLETAAREGLPSEKVQAAKKRLQRAAIFAREGLSAPGYVFGTALTTGSAVEDVEAWPDRIDAVTADQVNAALRLLVAEKRQIVGALLPKPKRPSPKAGKAEAE